VRAFAVAINATAAVYIFSTSGWAWTHGGNPHLIGIAVTVGVANVIVAVYVATCD
jgi:hypothetical protein